MRYAAVLVLAGCTLGPPHGFGPGESWTFPLVDPLADGLIVAPATIAKGTLLFALGVTPNGMVPPGRYGREWGPHRVAVLGPLVLGTLHIDAAIADEVHLRPEDTRKRDVAGDLQVDLGSLVFGVDRDSGIGWLATPSHAMIPADARSFEIRSRDHFIYVTAMVDGRPRKLVLDLMDGHSRLRVPGRHAVEIGDVSRFGIDFEPLDNAFPLESDIDGVLGLDFFRELDWIVDFDTRRTYVTPRRAVAAAARIARWQFHCPHTGCAALAMKGRRIEVTPERAPLQIVVAATAAEGTRLPPFEIDIDADGTAFAMDLDAEYADAALEIVDASPFPRTCAGANQCITRY